MTHPDPMEAAALDAATEAYLARLTKWAESEQDSDVRIARREAIRDAISAYHAAQPNLSREDQMVVLERDPNGRPIVWADPEIAPIVHALNKAGIHTVASCSGHGHRPGNVALADGRFIVILPNRAAFEIEENLWPLDINGDIVPQPKLSEELKAIQKRFDQTEAYRKQAGWVDKLDAHNDIRKLLRIVSDVVRACAGIIKNRAWEYYNKEEQFAADGDDITAQSCNATAITLSVLATDILFLLGQPIKSEAEIRSEEREKILQEIAIRDVLKVLGSYDKPGFDACVNAELADLRKQYGVG